MPPSEAAGHRGLIHDTLTTAGEDAAWNGADGAGGCTLRNITVATVMEPKVALTGADSSTRNATSLLAKPSTLNTVTAIRCDVCADENRSVPEVARKCTPLTAVAPGLARTEYSQLQDPMMLVRRLTVTFTVMASSRAVICICTGRDTW
jgi:hypothetical protein